MADHRVDAGQNFAMQDLPCQLQIVQRLPGEHRLGQKTGDAVGLLLLGHLQLHGKVFGVQVQGAVGPEGRGQGVLIQISHIAGQLPGVEVEYGLDLGPVLRGDGVAGDQQHVVDALNGQTQQQGLGGVQVPVPAGHVGQRLHAQLPAYLAGQQAAVRPGAADGAVGDGHRVGSCVPELLNALQEELHMVVHRRVQLHSDDPLSALQLVPQGVGVGRDAAASGGFWLDRHRLRQRP